MGKIPIRWLALAGLLMVGEKSFSQEPRPLIRSVETVEVAPLTGPKAPGDMRTPDICGSDIGTMTELGGSIYFAFGDTFGYRGEDCPKFGPNWRSNVLATTSDHDPSDGITLEGWLSAPDGTAVAVTEGAHQPAFTDEDGEQTRIPTALVAVGERIYLHYMSVHGFAAHGGVWSCNFSRFVYSNDRGATWFESEENFGGRSTDFNMLALTTHGGYVYAIGTPCGRFGPARAARVVADDTLLDPDAWRYFDGSGWSSNRDNAVEVIPAPVGEGSLVWNPGLQRWLYSYLNEQTVSLELREANNPWGPWSEPVVLASAGHFPQLYGAFMTPSFIDDDGRTLYYVMSRFGPYNAFLMKAELDVE